MFVLKPPVETIGPSTRRGALVISEVMYHPTNRPDAKDLEFIEASVLDRDAVRRAMDGVDHVFHLAAMISVPESMQKPIECDEINTKGTLVVLEEAARAKVKKSWIRSLQKFFRIRFH